jgi:predicted Fe-S protein YdhL (DUF1289 family)
LQRCLPHRFTLVAAEADLSTFLICVAHILRLLKIDITDESMPAGREVFTLTLESGLAIHLIGSQSSYLNIWSFPGLFPKSAPNSELVKLLAVNSFVSAHPPVCVGLERDSQEIIVWTRQTLTELNEVVLTDLFDRFVYTAEALHRSLTTSGSKKFQRSTRSIEAMLRSKVQLTQESANKTTYISSS